MRFSILERFSNFYRSLGTDEEDLRDEVDFCEEFDFDKSKEYSEEDFLKDLNCFTPLDEGIIHEIHEFEELDYSIVHFRETYEDNIYFGNPCGTASYKLNTSEDLEDTFYLVEEKAREGLTGFRLVDIVESVDHLVDDELLEEVDQKE